MGDVNRKGFGRFLESRWVLPAALLLPLLFQIQALEHGLALDDFLQHAKLLQGIGFETQAKLIPDYFTGNPVVTMFEFFPPDAVIQQNMREVGVLPWWSAPESSAVFFRPLSAFTHVVDLHLFGKAYGAYHLHSFAWAALGVWAVARVYRTVIPIPAVAGLAVLAFALEDAHVLPTAWLANRNAWIAIVFGMLALERHISAQEKSSPLAALFFALALAAGEMGLSVGAYILAWELWMRRDSVRSKFIRLLPYALVFLVWAALYKGGSYGVIGSGLYTDPIKEPVSYLSALPLKALALMSGQLLQIPSELWVLIPANGVVWGNLLAVAGIVGVLFWLSAWLRTTPERMFWCTGMLLCILPVCGSFPMDRLLIFVGVGFFPLLAEAWWGAWRGLGSSGKTRGRILHGLFWMHVPLAALALPVKTHLAGNLFERVGEVARMPLPAEELIEKDLIVVGTMDIGHAMMPLMRSHEGLPSPRGSFLLGGISTVMDLRRIDAFTLEVRYPNGILPGRIDRMVRSERYPFVPGERVEAGLFEAIVLEGGGLAEPSRVHFVFKEPLDSPQHLWMAFQEGKMSPFEPPELGETLRVEPLNGGDLIRFVNPQAFVLMPSD